MRKKSARIELQRVNVYQFKPCMTKVFAQEISKPCVFFYREYSRGSARVLLPVLPVGPPPLLQGDAIDKTCGCRTPNPECSPARHKSADNVSPTRKEFQRRASAFAQKHRCADIRTPSACEFG